MSRKSSENRSCDDSSLPQGSLVLTTVILILAVGVVLILRGLA